MSLHTRTRNKPRRHGKAMVAGLFAASVGLLTTAGVYAALSGVATGSEAVTSGTLNLTLSADVGAGFSSFVGKMAPGDTDNVYVNLNNTGTLASGAGLTVTATQCSVAWTLATGVCSGTTTPILTTAQISTMNTSGTAVSLSNVPSLAASTDQVAHDQFSLGLVGTETSTNGVAPTPTIQGLSTTLAYSF